MWDKRVLLGSGTFGKVYEVVVKNSRDIVAIKVLEKSRETYQPQRIKEEINILTQLRGHRNIVQLLETIKSKNSLFLVYEYAKHDLMGLLNAPDYLFKMPDIKNIMVQLLHGVKFIHEQGFIHRDIKPANILINDRGEVKIADFGLATRNHDREKSAVVCTLWYRPIELCFCEKTAKYGPEIDMWSVGLVFAELLRKTRPLEGNPAMFRTDDPNELVDMVLDFVGTTRSDKAIKYLEALPLAKKFDLKRKREPILFKTFDFVEKEAASLLNWFLQLYPEGRCTAFKALNRSRYFFTLPYASRILTLPMDQCNERKAKEYLKRAGLMNSKPHQKERSRRPTSNRGGDGPSMQIPPDSNKLGAAALEMTQRSSGRKRSREALSDSGGSISTPRSKRPRNGEQADGKDTTSEIEVNPRFLPSTGSRISPSNDAPLGLELIDMKSKPVTKVHLQALTPNFPTSLMQNNKSLIVAHQLTQAQYEDWKKKNAKCTSHRVLLTPMSSDTETECFQKFCSSLLHAVYYVKNEKVMMCVRKTEDAKQMSGILFLK